MVRSALICTRPYGESGTLQSTGRIRDVFDKGQNAIAIIDTETMDQTGQKVFSTSWSIVCVGQGSFGGQRGDRPMIPTIIDESALLMDTHESTRPEQGILYRLNGDLNPLHVDPHFAPEGRLFKPNIARFVHIRICAQIGYHCPMRWRPKSGTIL